LTIYGIRVRAKVFLDGPYNSTTGLMSDSLRSKNLIPSSEPYTSMVGYGELLGISMVFRGRTFGLEKEMVGSTVVGSTRIGVGNCRICQVRVGTFSIFRSVDVTSVSIVSKSTTNKIVMPIPRRANNDLIISTTAFILPREGFVINAPVCRMCADEKQLSW
jgi:hypothetical protein